MKFIIALTLILICTKGFSKKDSVSVLFYNVENLFDTKDDSTKNDNEFLPEKKKHWNNKKWEEKTTRIAKVIAAADYPDVIGLAEIENDSVLFKLANHFILRKKQYKVIHFEYEMVCQFE